MLIPQYQEGIADQEKGQAGSLRLEESLSLSTRIYDIGNRDTGNRTVIRNK